jgi:hypothetical protein
VASIPAVAIHRIAIPVQQAAMTTPAWASQAGFSQRSILPQAGFSKQALHTLKLAICAFAGGTHLSDSLQQQPGAARRLSRL